VAAAAIDTFRKPRLLAMLRRPLETAPLGRAAPHGLDEGLLRLQMGPFPTNIGIRCSRIPAAATACGCGSENCRRSSGMCCGSPAAAAERVVEIQAVDAVRLYGSNGIWKDVAQRLLDNTCQQRTGRHEEDGCWPGFGQT
jgi:hypothetical protein